MSSINRALFASSHNYLNVQRSFVTAKSISSENENLEKSIGYTHLNLNRKWTEKKKVTPSDKSSNIVGSLNSVNDVPLQTSTWEQRYSFPRNDL